MKKEGINLDGGGKEARKKKSLQYDNNLDRNSFKTFTHLNL